MVCDLSSLVEGLKSDELYPSQDCIEGIRLYLGEDLDSNIPLFVSLGDYPVHMTVRSENMEEADEYLRFLALVTREIYYPDSLPIWLLGNKFNVPFSNFFSHPNIEYGLGTLKALAEKRTNTLLEQGRKDLFYYNKFTKPDEELKRILVFCFQPSVVEQVALYNLVGGLANVGIHLVISSSKLLPQLKRQIYSSVELEMAGKGSLHMSDISTTFSY